MKRIAKKHPWVVARYARNGFDLMAHSYELTITKIGGEVGLSLVQGGAWIADWGGPCMRDFVKKLNGAMRKSPSKRGRK